MLQRHQALKRYRHTHYTLHLLDCDFTPFNHTTHQNNRCFACRRKILENVELDCVSELRLHCICILAVNASSGIVFSLDSVHPYFSSSQFVECLHLSTTVSSSLG